MKTEAELTTGGCEGPLDRVVTVESLVEGLTVAESKEPARVEPCEVWGVVNHRSAIVQGWQVVSGNGETIEIFYPEQEGAAMRHAFRLNARAGLRGFSLLDVIDAEQRDRERLQL